MTLNLKSRETNVSAHTGLIWEISCCLWAGGREKREGACTHMLLDSAPCSLQPPGCVSTQLVPEASFRRNSLVGGVETYKRGLRHARVFEKPGNHRREDTTRFQRNHKPHGKTVLGNFFEATSSSLSWFSSCLNLAPIPSAVISCPQ